MRLLDRGMGSVRLRSRQKDGVGTIGEFPQRSRGNEVPDNKNGQENEEAEKDHLEEPETGPRLVPVPGFGFDIIAQDGSCSRCRSPKNFIWSKHDQGLPRSECTIVGSAKEGRYMTGGAP